jgi:lipid II:glycine glycyltransferase (peptidoglycan interpeptide bridge formation enzyme)
MGAEPALRVEPAGLEVLAANRSLLQSRFWAEFRRRLGWEPRAFRVEAGGRGLGLLVLVRPLPLRQRLAYVPHGPETPGPELENGPFLAALAAALRPHLKGCLFLRYDLPWAGEREGEEAASGACEAGLRAAGLRKAPMDIQPPDTVILDLGYEEESLLAAMKAKTRYNIGLAAKKGVRVEEGGAADLPAWYELYRQTARRDRIALHDYEYYRRQFELAQGGAGAGPRSGAGSNAGAAPELKLLLARHEGDLLAGILVAVHGRAATYLYGASSDAKRNLMPAYALQWEAIRLARRRGCLTYDLFGIPPSADPSHPMYGLYRFKTGFGGRMVHRPGCWDFAYRRAGYAAYAAAELARAWYFRRFRKAARESRHGESASARCESRRR